MHNVSEKTRQFAETMSEKHGRVYLDADGVSRVLSDLPENLVLRASELREYVKSRLEQFGVGVNSDSGTKSDYILFTEGGVAVIFLVILKRSYKKCLEQIRKLLHKKNVDGVVFFIDANAPEPTSLSFKGLVATVRV